MVYKLYIIPIIFFYLFNSYYKTKVTFEAPDNETLKSAEDHLKSLIEQSKLRFVFIILMQLFISYSSGYVVDFIADTITDPWPHTKLLDPETKVQFDDAMSVVEKCFQQFR